MNGGRGIPRRRMTLGRDVRWMTKPVDLEELLGVVRGCTRPPQPEMHA